MKKRVPPKRFSQNAAMAAALLAALAIVFGTYVKHEYVVNRANDARISSLLLAGQLRQSTDDLTRMARAYVATGDPAYKGRYLAILDVRDGRSHSPANDSASGWELQSPSTARIRGVGPRAVALLEQMRAAGFTRSEFAKVAEAKALSDSLTLTELRAMELAGASTRSRNSQRETATAMLYDSAYARSKGAIVGRIDEFVREVDLRTLAVVDRVEMIALIVRFIFITLGVGLALMLWRTYDALRETMGGSVRDVIRRISALGGGDFGVADGETAPRSSVLGRLVEAQTKLADLNRERVLNEERMRSVLDNALDCIVSMSADGRIVEFNPAAERTFGYSKEEAIGKTLSELIIPPALRVSHEQGLKRFLDTGASRIIGRRVEVPAMRADGSEILVELAVTSLGTQTPPVFTGFLRDISDHRRDEDKLRQQASLLDKAQEAIVVRDLDHRIQYWNKGAERLYGWSSAEAIGQPAVTLFTTDSAAFTAASVALLAAGEWIGELENTTRDGRSLTIESRWTLVRDGNGAPESIMTIDADITQRKMLEQHFLRAQRLESIGTLAGGIAHDLNNVLVPIMLATDLLKESEKNPDDLELLETIASSSRRGADMVSQVLSFARGMDGRRIDVRAKDLLADVEKITTDTFSKSIQIRTVIDPDLWMIRGDPTQLHQVLLNLCVNARDAMPDGGRISIAASNAELEARDVLLVGGSEPGRYVVIEVEDTGEGIPATVIDSIFDPFFTTKELGKGTGLGLSTSLGIVRGHGGFIHVYSEQGAGTRFRVYLPAHIEVKRATPAVPIPALPRGAGETVLVVDDEAAIRQVTGRTLEAAGYRVLMAADGAQAVEVYAQHRSSISVVLTDMMMPVMDGPATIQALEKMNSDVRIIAASGLSANRGVAIDAGKAVRHFLAKPYAAETLLAAVESVLSETGTPTRRRARAGTR